MANDDIDSLDVNEIIKDIQQGTSNIKKTLKIEGLNSEDLEKFILDYGGHLVKESVESLSDVKDYLRSVPGDSETIESYASLLKAATTALDQLQKVHTAKERNQTAVELKKLTNNQDQKQLEFEKQKFIASREDLMKELFKKADRLEETNPIEADVEFMDD